MLPKQQQRGRPFLNPRSLYLRSDSRAFIVKDKKVFTRKPTNTQTNSNAPDDYYFLSQSPAFNRSNSTLKLAYQNDPKPRFPEEKPDYPPKVLSNPKPMDNVPVLGKAVTLPVPELTEMNIMTSKPYKDLWSKFEYEREKTSKLKRMLTEREGEIQELKKDKLQLYNKLAMMEEQLRNYEVALEERKNSVEMSTPDLQSLLLMLRYSGVHVRRRPTAGELNPDNMTYEELMHLEEQMGTVNRGFTEEQLTRLNTFIFNSKFNPNCNNQDSCTVCFNEYAAGNRCSKLSCGHVYHYGCIKPWLLKEKTCPVCKALVSL